jgi:plasmid stability protein
MEEEAREILRNSVNEGETGAAGVGSEIASLFRKTGLETDIPEFRGQTLKPPQFKE